MKSIRVLVIYISVVILAYPEYQNQPTWQFNWNAYPPQQQQLFQPQPPVQLKPLLHQQSSPKDPVFKGRLQIPVNMNVLAKPQQPLALLPQQFLQPQPQPDNIPDPGQYQLLCNKVAILESSFAQLRSEINNKFAEMYGTGPTTNNRTQQSHQIALDNHKIQVSSMLNIFREELEKTVGQMKGQIAYLYNLIVQTTSDLSNPFQ